MKFLFSSLILGLLWISACTPASHHQENPAPLASTYLRVMGVAQDAGFPQINCQKSCCQSLWSSMAKRQMVSCLALADLSSKQAWIFDATPDFKQQHHQLLYGSEHPTFSLAGIFLTHAHIGHYTGLMHLGREAMGAKEVPVYAMPRMKTYLETNGPWSQLVDLKNIRLQALKTDSSFQLTPQLRVDALLVPHRDEFSETVGFLIQSPNKKALFIPDIDKWHLWDRDILQLIRAVDYAFLDGTFFENGEIPGRDMSEIPHPFVEESMQLFDVLAAKDRAKVHFIHFNHTNPILQFNSEAQRMVQQRGYNIAKEGMLFSMD